MFTAINKDQNETNVLYCPGLDIIESGFKRNER